MNTGSGGRVEATVGTRRPRAAPLEVGMLIRKSRTLSLLLACGVLCSAAPAFADGAEAETRVREANDRLRELLRDTPDAAEVGQLVDSLLDYDGLAQRALSAHWDRLTQAQKDEFLNLFKALVAKSYRDNLKDTLDNIAINFLGWEQTTAGSVMVKTRVRKLQTRRNRRAEESRSTTRCASSPAPGR